jgi:hypothetical protein
MEQLNNLRMSSKYQENLMQRGYIGSQNMKRRTILKLRILVQKWENSKMALSCSWSLDLLK